MTRFHPEVAGRDLVLVVVVLVLAVVLAVFGVPLIGIVEFLGGVLYVACHTVSWLRGTRLPAAAGI